jgi:hypothetical protein
MALPVSAGAVRKLLREAAGSGPGDHVLAVGGASELASELRQQLLRGRAEPGVARLGDPEGADVYVHVLAAPPGDEDVRMLRRARRARVPAIAVAVGFALPTTIPYVLATDVVWVGAGRPFPLEAIARAIARRLVAGWVTKAGVAYAGTRALGEAARMRFALAPTQQPGGAERAAP